MRSRHEITMTETDLEVGYSLYAFSQTITQSIDVGDVVRTMRNH